MTCIHIIESKEVKGHTNGCEECLKTGDSWIHLRLCLTCGHVGCCEQSMNKHAEKHFHNMTHPVIRSFEKGEDWKYCYLDDEYS